MSWTDGVIGVGFELATNVPMEEVNKINEELKDEKNNPRDYKMRLAYEIVKINQTDFPKGIRVKPGPSGEGAEQGRKKNKNRFAFKS